MTEENIPKKTDPQSRIVWNDIKVPADDEVAVKSEIKAQNLPDLIQQFHNAKTDEERAKLQKIITRIAKSVRDIGLSNEP